MNREKQIENERYDIARIMAENFHINGEGWDESTFEWTAHCVQMEGYRKQSEPISCGHEKGGEWISVDERLPETPDRVLVYLNADSTGRSGFIDTDRILNGRWVRWGSNVDYWMALPQPPKMKGGDNDA